MAADPILRWYSVVRRDLARAAIEVCADLIIHMLNGAGFNRDPVAVRDIAHNSLRSWQCAGEPGIRLYVTDDDGRNAISATLLMGVWRGRPVCTIKALTVTKTKKQKRDVPNIYPGTHVSHGELSVHVSPDRAAVAALRLHAWLYRQLCCRLPQAVQILPYGLIQRLRWIPGRPAAIVRLCRDWDRSYFKAEGPSFLLVPPVAIELDAWPKTNDVVSIHVPDSTVARVVAEFIQGTASAEDVVTVRTMASLV